ncbi:hypothetical protein [Paenibacillus sp. MCAF9]|uniref:hypothetical protein n=1 Tax=Paenibacillus sp. MCAF9 TaxID=3233046 RepID=UPI003F979E2F
MRKIEQTNKLYSNEVVLRTASNLTKEELTIALTKANKAPFLRDKVMEKLVASAFMML